MVWVLLAVTGGVLALGLVVWASHRMLMAGGDGSTGGDPFGVFVEVFEPARDRANRDLDSREHQAEAVLSPGADDRPVRVDLTTGRATVRRPRS
ncbi:hypothetical protein [Nocardioides lianchengensis]|uniref:Uncharacterized protein n=1 Tax=Nocardioides lianchengensis TaxID=1045774 RepID=A0A1G6NDL0_9ACTN|nr:hypothetical protein [Nocardioides lianchengensis]NYG10737.1 hypothetical protein [Nocardioides lianchengensis]SDC65862.1 hypothetical protein SAMN05421872_103220 [Nocardioides lianchengensis]